MTLAITLGLPYSFFYKYFVGSNSKGVDHLIIEGGGVEDLRKKFLQSPYSKKKIMQHEWLKKNEYTALKNCLHHWPVRKKIIALTNSSTQAPPKRSNSPEMGHLSANGVEKESPKIRTVIN